VRAETIFSRGLLEKKKVGLMFSAEETATMSEYIPRSNSTYADIFHQNGNRSVSTRL
jgi:hypothetical protein